MSIDKVEQRNLRELKNTGYRNKKLDLAVQINSNRLEKVEDNRIKCNEKRELLKQIEKINLQMSNISKVEQKN